MTQPIRRRRGLTEQAAAAAIDTACRQLCLPTVRELTIGGNIIETGTDSYRLA